MIPNRSIFSINFYVMPEPIVDAWDTTVSFLRSQKCLPKEFRLSQIAGHIEELRSERDLKIEVSGVRDMILERRLKGFSVQSGRNNSNFHLRLLKSGPDGKGAAMTTTLASKSKVPETWNNLIEGMLIQWPGIVSRQWNAAYAGWQNSREIETYKVLHGDIPDGIQILAIPTEGISTSKEVIDTSKNPGRYKTIYPGIYFSPTAEMWLGDHFWQYAKCSKEDVLAADFFLEVRDTPHFLYLKSWPHPFTRPDGEQGRVQQKLWRLLFHEDCEWPPGSGGISDEAIYGPPELMPKDSSIWHR